MIVCSNDSQLRFTEALRRFVCLACYFEWTSTDPERCPLCESEDIHKEH